MGEVALCLGLRLDMTHEDSTSGRGSTDFRFSGAMRVGLSTHAPCQGSGNASFCVSTIPVRDIPQGVERGKPVSVGRRLRGGDASRPRPTRRSWREAWKPRCRDGACFAPCRESTARRSRTCRLRRGIARQGALIVLARPRALPFLRPSLVVSSMRRNGGSPFPASPRIVRPLVPGYPPTASRLRR